MERPGDDYKEKNNVTLKRADELGVGLVSRLQIAEICVEAILNPKVSTNKIVEVIATPEFPKKPIVELFEQIPSD